MTRLFRRLLSLYPRPVRERLGAAMLETFEEEWAAVRARGAGPSALFLVRTIVFTPLFAFEEHGRGLSLALRSGGWGTDVRHAIRSVLRSPGFALGTALTVGLGVGATVSIYTVAEATLLRELPVLEPDRLVRFAEDRDRYQSEGPEGPRIPVDRYQRLRDALTGPAFSGLAGHNRRTLSLRADGPSFSAMGELTSGNYFAVLGLQPAAGRFFTGDDEASMVLGHQLWQSRFGGRDDVLGRTISISGRPFTVVGVAPADFASTIGFLHIDFFVPVGAYDGAAWPRAMVTLFGRLAPGVDRETAATRASTIVTRFPPEVDPEAELRGANLSAMTSIPPSLAGPLTGFLGMLFTMAMLVLLIASANVAGILLARAARRERETAVRLALGVGRGRLARQWIIEAVGLFVTGGLIGVGIAAVVGAGLSRISLPVDGGIVVDAAPGAGALALAMALATVAGLAFGTLPAVHAARSEVAPRLRNGSFGTSHRTSRARGVFVTAQLALSVVLLVAATLFVRTAHTSMNVDLGFEPQEVVIARVNLGAHDYSEAEGRLFFDRLGEDVRSLPGVESASLASLALMTGAISSYGGWRLDTSEDGVSVRANRIDEHYFETMGIELSAGRGIGPDDVEDAPDVLVVNESFARRFWPNESPLGKTILRTDRPYTVVGVVPDGRYVDFGSETSAFVFLSTDQHYGPSTTIHLKSRLGPETTELVQAVRERVAALDPDVAVVEPMPLETAMGVLLLPQRFAATLIGVFGLLGLVLAAIGVYGVLAQHVVQRAREFGVRIALGAKPRGLLGSVLWRAVTLAAIGAAVGITVSAAVTRLLASLLLGLDPYDPVAFVGVPLVLGLVALAAGVLPARRILSLDPVETLKRE
ncbi:MAG: FtsX-like permease family protein [Gemmatimonadetes bacterium]|nr:ABC transporter permease [Gemmatimonadota bacterium]NNF15012.1 FtsX-like permease family protein [Gemmatimonadota bacterium]